MMKDGHLNMFRAMIIDPEIYRPQLPVLVRHLAATITRFKSQFDKLSPNHYDPNLRENDAIITQHEALRELKEEAEDLSSILPYYIMLYSQERDIDRLNDLYNKELSAFIDRDGDFLKVLAQASTLRDFYEKIREMHESRQLLQLDEDAKENFEKISRDLSVLNNELPNWSQHPTYKWIAQIIQETSSKRKEIEGCLEDIDAAYKLDRDGDNASIPGESRKRYTSANVTPIEWALERIEVLLEKDKFNRDDPNSVPGSLWHLKIRYGRLVELTRVRNYLEHERDLITKVKKILAEIKRIYSGRGNAVPSEQVKLELGFLDYRIKDRVNYILKTGDHKKALEEFLKWLGLEVEFLGGIAQKTEDITQSYEIAMIERRFTSIAAWLRTFESWESIAVLLEGGLSDGEKKIKISTDESTIFGWLSALNTQYQKLLQIVTEDENISQTRLKLQNECKGYFNNLSVWLKLAAGSLDSLLVEYKNYNEELLNVNVAYEDLIHTKPAFFDLRKQDKIQSARLRLTKAICRVCRLTPLNSRLREQYQMDCYYRLGIGDPEEECGEFTNGGNS